MLEWFYLGYLGQEVVGRLPPVIGETEIDLLGLYKLVDDLGGYMNVEFNNHWSDVANMLGLTLEDKEAIKECYKEFIGMVKVYYEEAKRLKQGRPGLVVGLKAPQDFATTIAEVEEAPNATQARIAKENVKTDCSKEEGIASDETASDDSLVIIT
nr:bulb-type lectin domain-containing protein [Tanacetum cinerariifolium]